eukprot:444057-Rhodomonas_salina.1
MRLLVFDFAVEVYGDSTMCYLSAAQIMREEACVRDSISTVLPVVACRRRGGLGRLLHELGSVLLTLVGACARSSVLHTKMGHALGSVLHTVGAYGVSVPHSAQHTPGQYAD